MRMKMVSRGRSRTQSAITVVAMLCAVVGVGENSAKKKP